jgi:hypothetical protein
MARALATLVLFCLVVGCGGTHELSRSALDQDFEAIQSAAAEGALLSHDVANGRTTSTFARVHSGELARQANAVSERLQSAESSAGLEDDPARARRLATLVARNLERLDEASHDEARRIARRLEEAARAAERESA